MVYYMAGITISVAAFPKRVAVLSILYLALGDPFASTMGIKYGKLGPRFSNGKSLIGSVGGFAICAVTTGLYFAPSLQVSVTLGLVSLLGGIAGRRPLFFTTCSVSYVPAALYGACCSRMFSRRHARRVLSCRALDAARRGVCGEGVGAPDWARMVVRLGL